MAFLVLLYLNYSNKFIFAGLFISIRQIKKVDDYFPFEQKVTWDLIYPSDILE